MAINYYYYYEGGGYTDTIDTCIIEVHYRFNDGSHTMDAAIQNKCESALLRIITEIAKTCRANVSIGTEAKAEGGLINRYRIKVQNRSEKESKPISTPVKIALLSAIFIGPTTVVVNSITKVIKEVVTNRMKDPVMDSLEKEKLRTEIDNGKAELEIKKKKKVRDSLENEELEMDIRMAEEDFRRHLIKVNNRKPAEEWRFKFYQQLAKYNNVSSVSTQVFSGVHDIISPEFLIERAEFKASVDKMQQLLIDQKNSRAAYLDSVLGYNEGARAVRHTTKRLNTENLSTKENDEVEK